MGTDPGRCLLYEKIMINLTVSCATTGSDGGVLGFDLWHGTLKVSYIKSVRIIRQG